MQLRRFFTGLAIASATVLVSFSAGATTRILMGGLDRTIGSGGKNVCIVSGKVTNVSEPFMVNFPGSAPRQFPAIKYTIQGKVLQCSTRYTASDQIQDTEFTMFAGDIKDNPKPQLGQDCVWIWYGNSVVGLSSLVGGDEGRYCVQDGNVVSPYGGEKGLVIVNPSLAKKLETHPNLGKFLRSGPAVPTEEGGAAAGLTKGDVEDAVKTILKGNGGE